MASTDSGGDLVRSYTAVSEVSVRIFSTHLSTLFFLKNNFFDGKSVMLMFCNVIMLLLLYVHVCVTRTGWKTRPKAVILSIKKSNQISLTSFFCFWVWAPALIW